MKNENMEKKEHLKLIRFSEMLQKATGFKKIEGDKEGTCCLCGRHTSKGNKKKFGANFTCADYLGLGDVICEYCQHLASNSNTYRRTMFLLTEDEFKKFKKKDIKEVISNLPVNKPYYLYLTKTWQKLGWVRMNEVCNTGESSVINTLLDYDIITFTLKDLKSKYELVKKLRKLKISKDVLEMASFEMYQYKRIVDEYGQLEAHKILKTVEKYKSNPVWELAVYIND